MAVDAIAALALCSALLALPGAAGAATIRPGDVLVAETSGFGGPCAGGCGAVIAVDPATGQQSVVSSNAVSGPDLFDEPFGIVLDAAGRILVADANAFAGSDGGVIAVNPDSGQQTALSSNAISGPDHFYDPSGIALDATGRILVADSFAFGGTGGIIAIDPATGQQTALSNNTISGSGFFAAVRGLALDQAGRILVADSEAFGTTGGIIAVNPATGQQSAVSNNMISGPDLFSDPFGAALDAAGGILVADDNAFGGTGGIIAVNPATGQQTALSNNAISGPDLLVNLSAIAVDAAGRILVTDRGGPGDPGAVIAVTPATGQQTALSNNTISGPDLLDNPQGILVVPPRCFGRFPGLLTHVGSVGRDVIRGTRFADAIVGLGGNDRLIGRGGRDRLCGGNGKDTLKGGKGNDSLKGEKGKDRLFGLAGRDRLFGGPGRDLLNAGKGKRELCSGGLADDKAKGCERTRSL